MKNFYWVMVALCGATPVHAAEGEVNKQWEIGFSIGTNMIADAEDQTSITASVTREFDDAYLRLAASFSDPIATPGLLQSVSSKTQQISVSGGIGANAFSIDGRLSLGRRQFESESIATNFNPLVIDSDGTIFGVGASVTYDIAVSDHGFLSPSIGLDYDSVDIARLVTTPAGRLINAKEREHGFSGSAVISYAHVFGDNLDHNIGPYVALVASSNNVAFSSAATGERAVQLDAIRNIPGQGDIWLDFGGSASFGLSKNLRLRLSASQTLGFAGPEASSLSAGISIRF
ncbi:MAG: autotransporter domain-containing protein [Parasphingorhabdus sp.]|uniref:autotransporter domain-containing protein n=1 Tax=Parasphingorhabdus sp. TaxID=2709688 RepID=UPI003297921B